MSDYIVIDHHHDAESGFYKLTIGTAQEVQRPAFDGEGNPILEKVPVIGPDGPMSDVDGKEIRVWGGQATETVTEYVPVEDFLFADDDERWAGKSDEEVVQLQREVVKEQMAKRTADARDAADRNQRLRQLPGSGEAL